MCSKEEITRRSLIITANFKGQDHKLYKPDDSLRDLGWDDIGLSFLAMSLRALIGMCLGNNSIYTSELRKRGFKISDLVRLMISKINGAELNDEQIKTIIKAAQENI